MAGPLAGIRVIEMGGIGPAPYCGMLLGDLGAEVIRIERVSDRGTAPLRNDPHLRNRRSVALNLKAPEAVELILRLFETADACTEGFRPGVAERLGFGPEVALARNPRLVYGRMTGWGQDGPLAQAPGHDINYIALTGALHAIGPTGGKPVPPMNLLGDFGGGGLFLAFGLLAAMMEARRSGQGQVVDAAMVDGVASIASALTFYREAGIMPDDGPGTSALGGAAPYYDVYETSDGQYVSIGSLEPEFYEALVDALELDRDMFGAAAFAPGREDRGCWPALKAIVAERFRTRTRDEWCARLEGGDVCFAPVLRLDEAPVHPHNRARSAYVDVGGYRQNAPAPRFSRTSADPPRAKPRAGADTAAVLAELGIDPGEIARLAARGIIT
jgi:alpha-methylacyl-CoA racemase